MSITDSSRASTPYSGTLNHPRSPRSRAGSLVQNVVGDTAEQLASNDARQTAADLAATVLQGRWRAETPTDKLDAARINRLHSARCRQLGIIYSDISLKVEPPKGGKFDLGGPGWDDPTVVHCTFA